MALLITLKGKNAFLWAFLQKKDDLFLPPYLG